MRAHYPHARAGEELDVVTAELVGIPTSGCYAYGEFAPTATAPALLHNQIMTVTVFAEV